jgi:ATPase subunit of ABC transporter with duplicated ATPase domains
VRQEQRAESREQRAENREQRTENREQRAESREQRAESREQRAHRVSGLCIQNTARLKIGFLFHTLELLLFIKVIAWSFISYEGWESTNSV